MQFTKTGIKNARDELEAALRVVETKLGIVFQVGIIRYDSSTFRCKIEAESRTAKSAAPEKLDAIVYSKLGPNFDETKTYHSLLLGNVKVVGFNRRAKRYPFIVETAKGKKYKITTISVQDMVNVGPV